MLVQLWSKLEGVRFRAFSSIGIYLLSATKWRRLCFYTGLSVHGGSASVHAGIPPPPREQTPPSGRRLLLRTVRILLECILVSTTNDNCTKVNCVNCQFLVSKIAIAITVNRSVWTLNASCKAAEILGAESNPKAMLELETSAVRQSYIKCLNWLISTVTINMWWLLSWHPLRYSMAQIYNSKRITFVIQRNF